ncbi:hypothetical protein LOK49_LG12G00055 [Camellia lanceoleosa]|uniref:Uncharacterized protein n=1 Tax=Camellia lanceoleosa TaxID=1840588 RepID=A0ACC0FUJ9_9ERIC|nr:hypothetical protein LOK49_LG12G00055 [Camellia lanceoleosa]
METFSVIREDLDFVELPEGSDESVDISNRCLVGKVLAPKPLNKPAVANIIKGAWKPRANLVISPWADNLFMFHFDDVEDRRRALLEAPWSVMGFLLVLQLLSTEEPIEEMDFNWSPFWVQAHGLPVAKLTRQNGEIIGRRIGKFIGQKGPPAKETWISYKYEKLSDFCYDCGRLSHDNSACKFVSCEEGKISRYGPALRTGRASKLNISVQEVRHWVDKVEERVRNLVNN